MLAVVTFGERDRKTGGKGRRYVSFQDILDHLDFITMYVFFFYVLGEALSSTKIFLLIIRI